MRPGRPIPPESAYWGSGSRPRVQGGYVESLTRSVSNGRRTTTAVPRDGEGTPNVSGNVQYRPVHAAPNPGGHCVGRGPGECVADGKRDGRDDTYAGAL